MAPSDVAVATRSGSRARRMRSGTATIPPPTPKSAEKRPATRPMTTRRTAVSYERDPPGPEGCRRRRAGRRPGTGRRRLGVGRSRDGARRPSCYVASADLAKLRLSDAERARLVGLLAEGRALVRGTIVRGLVEGLPQLDTLVAGEVWTASSSHRLPTGTFRRLSDNGARCITTPCFSTDVLMLNRQGKSTVSRVGLAGVGATTPERNRALALLASGGLVAAGRVVAVPRAGPAGTGRVFVASQFYTRAR